MKATMTAVAAALLASQGAVAAQQTGQQSETATQEPAEGIPATPHQAGTAREIDSDVFVRLDQDGDGAISRQEAQDHPELTDNWSQYDQDGDGMLSSREFGDFRAETAAGTESGDAAMAGAGEEMPGTRHQEQTVGDDLVERLDTNGDGRISEQEAMAEARVAENWDRYDENGDGQLDSAELDRLEQELGETEEAE